MTILIKVLRTYFHNGTLSLSLYIYKYIYTYIYIYIYIYRERERDIYIYIYGASGITWERAVLLRCRMWRASGSRSLKAPMSEG